MFVRQRKTHVDQMSLAFLATRILRVRLWRNEKTGVKLALAAIPRAFREPRRQIALFEKCDPAYGAGVAKAVKPGPSGAVR